MIRQKSGLVRSHIKRPLISLKMGLDNSYGFFALALV